LALSVTEGLRWGGLYARQFTVRHHGGVKPALPHGRIAVPQQQKSEPRGSLFILKI
jgi:hypothetical protein